MALRNGPFIDGNVCARYAPRPRHPLAPHLPQPQSREITDSDIVSLCHFVLLIVSSDSDESYGNNTLLASAPRIIRSASS